jgi:hypothetical protein
LPKFEDRPHEQSEERFPAKTITIDCQHAQASRQHITEEQA